MEKSFMGKSVDTDKVSALIVEAADTLIVPRFKQLQQGEIGTKSGPDDLVTIADREAEAFLAEALPRLYPGTVLIGEESVSEGRASLETLKERDRLIWVADPVDGTHNFVDGKREFGVKLAAVYNDEVLYGWIYDVIGKKMMVAEKGAGAFFDGERLKTAAPKTIGDMTGHAGMKYFPEKVRPFLRDAKEKIGEVYSLSCAAHEYLRIASGLSDFGIYSRVKAWDHLAGTLAVREAGGSVSLWNGKPYVPSFSGHGLLVASSDVVASELREAAVDRIVEMLGVT
jgi:fructose-1,6-bisphosphatase/inositol monophosphatase family enzyme